MYHTNQKWNNDKCRCECKKYQIFEKAYIWNPASSSYKNSKYLASSIDNSLIICEEIIDAEANSYDEETKTVTTNLKKLKSVKQKIYIFCLLCYQSPSHYW